MMRNFSIFTFLVLILAGCENNNPAVQARLNTIDSLETVLAEVETAMAPYNDSTLKDDAAEVKRLHDYLEKHYPVLDDRSFWINKMNPTRRIYKSLGMFAGKQDEMQGEIVYTRKQLVELRNSIEDEKLSEAEQEDYLAVETRAVAEMHKALFVYEPEAKVCLAIWDTLGPKMYAIKSDLDTLNVDKETP
jgi:hypothetical protein